MPTLQLTVPVRAPASRVWQRITDWSRQGDWMLATRVRTVGPQRRGPGDRLEAFTGIGRLGFTDAMVVTNWVEATEVTVQHTGRVVRGFGTFRVEPIGDSASVLIWIESLRIPGGRLGAVAWRLAKPMSRWAVGSSLRRFARQVETADSQPPRR